MLELLFRPESFAELPTIREVVTAAFGRPAEARLVEALREGGYVRLSAVAVEQDRVVGHILFSELAISSPRGSMSALAMAPLVVHPTRQNLGIGAALTRFALEWCRTAGHRAVFVLGDPKYYRRFGFSVELARPFESEYAGDHFMALELVAGALSGETGRIAYPPPFSVEEAAS